MYNLLSLKNIRMCVTFCFMINRFAFISFIKM